MNAASRHTRNVVSFRHRRSVVLLTLVTSLGPLITPATDLSAHNLYCGDWAAAGECDRNAEYMLQTCPQACAAVGVQAAANAIESKGCPAQPACTCEAHELLHAEANASCQAKLRDERFVLESKAAGAREQLEQELRQAVDDAINRAIVAEARLAALQLSEGAGPLMITESSKHGTAENETMSAAADEGYHGDHRLFAGDSFSDVGITSSSLAFNGAGAASWAGSGDYQHGLLLEAVMAAAEQSVRILCEAVWALSATIVSPSLSQHAATNAVRMFAKARDTMARAVTEASASATMALAEVSSRATYHWEVSGASAACTAVTEAIVHLSDVAKETAAHHFEKAQNAIVSDLGIAFLILQNQDMGMTTIVADVSARIGQGVVALREAASYWRTSVASAIREMLCVSLVATAKAFEHSFDTLVCARPELAVWLPGRSNGASFRNAEERSPAMHLEGEATFGIATSTEQMLFSRLLVSVWLLGFSYWLWCGLRLFANVLHNTLRLSARAVVNFLNVWSRILRFCARSMLRAIMIPIRTIGQASRRTLGVPRTCAAHVC